MILKIIMHYETSQTKSVYILILYESQEKNKYKHIVKENESVIH